MRQQGVAKEKAWGAKQEKLIDVQNQYYFNRAQYTHAPKFTITEAMDLSRYGYTGLFKAGSKETIGLKGAAWQQYMALDAIRKKAELLPYQALETATVADAYKQGLAAKPITPGNKLFNDITALNTYFTDKYGAGGEKYASRYGHLPTAGTKYGLLFDLNDPKIRTDAAMSMYQNDLASAARAKGKELAAGTYSDPIAQANAAQLSSKLIGMGEDYRVKRTKWNKDKIGELEQAIGLDQGGYKWHPDVVKAVGSEPPKLDSNVGQTALSALGPGGWLLGKSSTVSELATKALGAMSDISSSSLLSPSQVNKTDNPIEFVSTLAGNTVKGLARMASGLPLGLYAVGESANKTVENIGKGKWQGDYTWAGIDTTLLDAMKSDYTARYKTPFDSGVANSTSWSNFGQKLAEDPVMPILDVLSIVPVVGQIAKGASIASTFGKFGKLGEVGGLSAETAAMEKLVSRAGGGGYDRHTMWRGPLEPTPNVAKVNEAQAAFENVKSFVDDANAAKANLSARRYRQLQREALAGRTDSMEALDKYRRLGLVIPDGKDSLTLRFGAKFEERTKIMEAPRATGDAKSGYLVAYKRLPASPLARGIGEGYEYILRTVDKKAAETMTATEGVMASGTAAKFADILVRLPLASYQYQYGRALKSAIRNYWGDTAMDVARAEALHKIQLEQNLSLEAENVILTEVAGGTGKFAYNDPAVRRPALEEALAEAEANPSATTPEHIAGLKAKLKALPDMTATEMFRKRLKEHMIDPNMHADDAEIVASAKLVREMRHQQERVHKIISSDTNPLGLEYLKTVFSEALVGLKMHEKNLWGDTGELTPYLESVPVINDAYHYHQYSATVGSEVMVNDMFKNIFDDIEDPKRRAKAIKDTHEGLKMLLDDGVFHDASGPSNVKGAPVVVVQKNQRGIPKGFVAVNRLRLDGGIENGRVLRSDLVDRKNTILLPKEVFVHDKAGNIIMHNADEAKAVVEQGAFNAMGDIFPNSHFYSDKVAESGLLGTASNFKDAANEHVVATLAIKEHTAAMHTSSQINFLKNRMERDIEPILMANAELIPASKLVGKGSKNYRILKAVQLFDNLQAAEEFARARGVLAQFDEGVKKMRDNPGSVAVTSPFDLEVGFGTLQHNGETLYAVRGDVRDWFAYAAQESASKLKDHNMYQRIMYDELQDLPNIGNTYVLAVPRSVDKAIQTVVREGNGYASEFLSNPIVKGSTNTFKRLVLNMSPRFIGQNVIGGMAMMMMVNPMAAGNILIKGLEAAAKRSGTTYWKNLSKDLKVLNHHLAYELEHNIYHNELSPTAIDAIGLKGKLDKYGWNAGYTTVAAFEATVRKLVAKDYLESDAVFQSFMRGPEVKAYIKRGVDYKGAKRNDITPFEAASDLLLDPQSVHYNPMLKTRMRYTTNTISGNYHQFSPTEQLLRNMLMPFYAWQRHSLAFTWRLPIDHPATAAALGHIGAYGYNQALQSGLPDWMYTTVPLPGALKSALDLEDSDYRIDMNSVSPFGTTADMALAGMNLLSGQETGANVLDFTNPYVNTAITQVTGVEPFTGKKVFDRKSFVDRVWDTAAKTPGISITKGVVFDSVLGEYTKDANANKYAAIQNANDILKNMEPGQTFGDWKLSVPDKLTQVRPGSYKEAATRLLFPVKLYAPELERMQGIAQKNALGAAILNGVQAKQTSTDAERAVTSVREWKNKRDYVMQVWLPYAEQSGTDPQTIQLVLTKLADEKPKRMKDSVFNSILQSLGG
jgi:hypothetical protein